MAANAPANAPADSSYITLNPDGTPRSFIGPDAVEIFRVRALISALELNIKTGMIPTRGVSARQLLVTAARHVQRAKPYRHSTVGKTLAVKNLRKWLAAAYCGIPLVDANTGAPR